MREGRGTVERREREGRRERGAMEGRWRGEGGEREGT